ncbi:MAG: IPT/TIG domain-containing protein [Acidobacteria bacterium]|nr:IPT/TIG domain-containing protein [Acidobacteriota bacterium]MBI3488291.1 IPT/TIG domain-containing protein [Acidobacteriota bacterium]
MTTRRTFIQVMASGATAALGLGCSGGGSGSKDSGGGTPGGDPRLDSLSPGHGKAGDSLTLNGQNLAATSQVFFGTTSTAPTAVTAATLAVTVPAGLAPGAVSVTARVGSATTNALTFTVDGVGNGPHLTDAAPAHALPGTTIQLNGQNLAAVVEVRFGTTTAVPQGLTATSLNVVVPSLAVGPVQIVAHSAAGDSNALPFSVDGIAPVPQLTSVAPASAAAGASVQLTGLNLAAVDAVKFGTVSAVPQSATATTLNVVVPAGLALGATSIVAHSSGGDSNALAFTVLEGTRPVVADPILVHIYLNGGNDLLDTLPPLDTAEAAAYLKARPKMHIDAADTFDTGKGFGISNRFLYAKKWWQDGRLALMPGIGVDHPNYSHFVSHDVWNWSTASTPDNTGWLGRWADTAFGNSDTMRALCIDSSLPGLAQGKDRQFVAISSIDGFRWPSMLAPWEWNNSKDFGVATWSNEDRLRTLYEPFLAAAKTETNAAVKGVGGGYNLFYTAQGEFNQRMAAFLVSNRTIQDFEKVLYPGDTGYALDPALPLPSGASGRITAKFGSEYSHVYLAAELKFIAKMIAADMPTQVYTAELAGFDTHADHQATHEYLIAALGACIESFFDQLKLISTAKGAAEDRVIVVVWSEFGRRIAESDSGTDHGAGGLAFAVGKPVKGGVHSAYPSLVASLADRALEGNLETTVNYLRLQATLLEKWLPGGAGKTAAILGSSDPKYIQPIPFL